MRKAFRQFFRKISMFPFLTAHRLAKTFTELVLLQFLFLQKSLCIIVFSSFHRKNKKLSPVNPTRVIFKLLCVVKHAPEEVYLLLVAFFFSGLRADIYIRFVGLQPWTLARATATTSLLCLTLTNLYQIIASQRHSFVPCGSFTRTILCKAIGCQNLFCK